MPPINNQDQKGPYLAQDFTHGIEQLDGLLKELKLGLFQAY